MLTFQYIFGSADQKGTNNQDTLSEIKTDLNRIRILRNQSNHFNDTPDITNKMIMAIQGFSSIYKKINLTFNSYFTNDKFNISIDDDMNIELNIKEHTKFKPITITNKKFQSEMKNFLDNYPITTSISINLFKLENLKSREMMVVLYLLMKNGIIELSQINNSRYTLFNVKSSVVIERSQQMDNTTVYNEIVNIFNNNGMVILNYINKNNKKKRKSKKTKIKPRKSPIKHIEDKPKVDNQNIVLDDNNVEESLISISNKQEDKTIRKEEKEFIKQNQQFINQLLRKMSKNKLMNKDIADLFQSNYSGNINKENASELCKE